MNSVERIKSKFERGAKALSLRPSMGLGTAVTKVRVKEGLFCEIEDGRWNLTSDLSEKSGGGGAAPDPGVFGRSALGACLAMGYVVWAAKRGVPIASIEVEIHADYDTRGFHGVDGVRAGYTEIRYVVRVESTAAEEEILRVLDEAEEHSDYYEVFRRPMKLRRETVTAAPRR